MLKRIDKSTTQKQHDNENSKLSMTVHTSYTLHLFQNIPLSISHRVALHYFQDNSRILYFLDRLGLFRYSLTAMNHRENG